MNSNNLENEKLPIDQGEGIEEPAKELLTEAENTQQESEVVEQDIPLADNADEQASDNVLEEATTEPDTTVEIDYDLEDIEDENVEDEGDEEEVDENNVDTSTELLSLDDILQKLRALLDSDNPQRKDFDDAKSHFYRALRNETDVQKTLFIEAGGESIDFVMKEDENFTEGKALIQKIKDKRSQIIAREEAEKENNVAKKLAIIEQVKQLSEAQVHEDFNKTYQDFRALQQKWNAIKLVPQAKVNELWKEYQRYVEKFYDLVRINNEFREYDFKKNLELKLDLCVAAEKLNDEEDIVSAFYQLQNLHQEWREIGPVSRKDREAIWDRFKEASTLINKKYQAHFESLKGKEEDNLAAKTALCETLEAIDYASLKTIKEWNAKIKDVLDIQKQWREIGYVPKKWNTKIYDRYRAACDFFFRNKNEFYKSLHGEMDENLKKRIALCERAEELKDSTDWRRTTQELISIQKEWKSIGLVPRKYVDSTWKRFISACDHFFEQKKLSTTSQKGEESNNLEMKREVVSKINTIDTSLSADEALPIIRELMNSWYAIGHVPFKVKDKTYKEFYEATEAQFDRLNIDRAERKLDDFKSNISEIAKSDNAKGNLMREREKLMRQYDRMKNELQTYENNIGFLSISSKKGSNLLDDMNDKVENIKEELELIVKKIDAIDKELA